MFSYFRGGLMEVSAPEGVLLVSGGMGFEVKVPVDDFNQLPSIGSEVAFWTDFALREEKFFIYGFLDRKKRDIFRLMRKVSGVGPSLALSVLGRVSFTQLWRAVVDRDPAMLGKVPGLSPQKGTKLIVELNLKKFQAILQSEGRSSDPIVKPSSPRDVLPAWSSTAEALMKLGFPASNAEQWSREAFLQAPEGNCSEWLRLALKRCL